MAIKKLLSKSSYLIYKQCPKYLWYYINERDNIPGPDLRTKFNFTLGHIIGHLAKKKYYDGIEVDSSGGIDQNFHRTRELLNSGKPLFEAGFLSHNEVYDLYSRADILVPVNSGKENPENIWDIIEVKSSTSVKEINLYDVAFQKYCYQKSGIKIRNCFVMHINNEYCRQGEVDPCGIFREVDVTEEVNKIYPHIKNDLKQMAKIIYNPNYPELKVGKFCDNPFSCPLKEKCWKYISKNSIFNLYAITRKIIKRLGDCGIDDIEDIPDDFTGINYKQKIQIKCVKNAVTHIDHDSLQEFMQKFEYPVYFLDFETFASPIPLIEGTRPYQNIPFQFSLHILRDPYGKLEHHSFLYNGPGDPRRELLVSLQGNFGLDEWKESDEFQGSVVVYNESFERSVLRDLAAFQPSHSSWIFAVASKIIDLYDPFKNFYYYHKEQRGSASIKKVLPALTGKSYEGMAIANGDIASISFLQNCSLWKNYLKNQGLRENEDKTDYRIDLEQYCKLDTEGLFHIMMELQKILYGNNNYMEVNHGKTMY